MKHTPPDLVLPGFQPDPLFSRLGLTAELYMVGGAVRDTLMGRSGGDKDWVVVGAKVEDLLDLGFTPVGSDFPVFLHPITKEEWALARTERKSGQGYQGFTFHAEPTVTLEEDLARRDFTINAMAMSSSGELIDFHGGQTDLQHQIMRHVSPAFVEDPLRVLRLARFLACFTQFSVAQETLELSQTICKSGELRYLVAERVFAELNKGMGAEKPSRMIALLNTLNVWQELATHCLVPFARFDTTALEHLDSLEAAQDRWVYSLGLFLNPTEINTLVKAWRLPSTLGKLSVVTSHLVQFIKQGELNANLFGQFFSQVDLYRKPARLGQVNNLVRHVLGESALHGFIEQMVAAVGQGRYQAFLTDKIAKRQSGEHVAQVAAQARQVWLNSLYANHFGH